MLGRGLMHPCFQLVVQLDGSSVGDDIVGDGIVGDGTVGDGVVGDVAVGDVAVGDDAVGDGPVGVQYDNWIAAVPTPEPARSQQHGDGRGSSADVSIVH